MRSHPVTSNYVLFVDGRAAGVIEAKKAGNTLSGIADQSEKYMGALPPHLAAWGPSLIFDYESTGDETYFRDMRDPNARSRGVFAVHRPETLHGWLLEPDTLRARLMHPPPLEARGLRDCQVEAIHRLEASFAEAKPRALIQVATGAGKTFTACNFSWRLLKHAKARRILFLMDRSNLGNQTQKEFQTFDPPGASGKFTDIYITQHLKSARLDEDAKVVIATIQRVYSLLRGEELDETADETSAFETWDAEEGEVKPIAYNSSIPIETFDIIITDECHRSIYGLWRQVSVGVAVSSRRPAVVYGLTNCNAADDCRNSASKGDKDERTHSRKGDAAYYRSLGVQHSWHGGRAWFVHRP